MVSKRVYKCGGFVRKGIVGDNMTPKNDPGTPPKLAILGQFGQKWHFDDGGSQKIAKKSVVGWFAAEKNCLSPAAFDSLPHGGGVISGGGSPRPGRPGVPPARGQ